MHLSWGASILMICVVTALACIIAGAVAAALAAQRVKRHMDALQQNPLVARATDAPRNVERINRDLAAMTELLDRAKRALEELARAMNELRIPEAVAGLRIAGAAIRLLLSGR